MLSWISGPGTCAYDLNDTGLWHANVCPWRLAKNHVARFIESVDIQVGDEMYGDTTMFPLTTSQQELRLKIQPEDQIPLNRNRRIARGYQVVSA